MNNVKKSKKNKKKTKTKSNIQIGFQELALTDHAGKLATLPQITFKSKENILNKDINVLRQSCKPSRKFRLEYLPLFQNISTRI